jgi:hypothetical protein
VVRAKITAQEKASAKTSPVLIADDENVPEDDGQPDAEYWSKWRGLIRVTNLVDLEFIARTKNDIAALIAEVERLRG